MKKRQKSGAMVQFFGIAITTLITCVPTHAQWMVKAADGAVVNPNTDGSYGYDAYQYPTVQQNFDLDGLFESSPPSDPGGLGLEYVSRGAANNEYGVSYPLGFDYIVQSTWAADLSSKWIYTGTGSPPDHLNLIIRIQPVLSIVEAGNYNPLPDCFGMAFITDSMGNNLSAMSGDSSGDVEGDNSTQYKEVTMQVKNGVGEVPLFIQGNGLASNSNPVQEYGPIYENYNSGYRLTETIDDRETTIKASCGETAHAEPAGGTDFAGDLKMKRVVNKPDIYKKVTNGDTVLPQQAEEGPVTPITFTATTLGGSWRYQQPTYPSSGEVPAIYTIKTTLESGSQTGSFYPGDVSAAYTQNYTDPFEIWTVTSPDVPPFFDGIDPGDTPKTETANFNIQDNDGMTFSYAYNLTFHPDQEFHATNAPNQHNKVGPEIPISLTSPTVAEDPLVSQGWVTHGLDAAFTFNDPGQTVAIIDDAASIAGNFPWAGKISWTGALIAAFAVTADALLPKPDNANVSWTYLYSLTSDPYHTSLFQQDDGTLTSSPSTDPALYQNYDMQVHLIPLNDVSYKRCFNYDASGYINNNLYGSAKYNTLRTYGVFEVVH